MPVEWYGDKVASKMQKATAFGIDQTLAACVVNAKGNYYQGHGLRTSTLQGSVQARPAEIRSTGDVVGYWGSFDVDYAIYIEKGTGRIQAQRQLQNAADEEYPKLAERIRRRFEG